VAKLLVAIVHPLDAEAVNEAIRNGGYAATRLGSIGGFLGGSSSTFLMAIEDTDEAAVLAIFERTCKAHEVQVPLVLHERLKDLPNLVSHSGAHVFVVELARHLRF
jgi:uncharacterized protein YaaQ